LWALRTNFIGDDDVEIDKEKISKFENFTVEHGYMKLFTGTSRYF
jgi:hypothetical protein